MFAQGVKPEKYKLFQLADLVCTAKLAQQKITLGLPLTEDEFRFYGGPRRFMRNIWNLFAKVAPTHSGRILRLVHVG